MIADYELWLYSALSHTAPLVIPPSDTVFRESYQRLRVGFGRPSGWFLCPLRTVLLTVVFTLWGQGFFALSKKQQEEFL